MVKTIRMLALAGAVVIGGAAASPLAAQGARQDPVPASFQPPPGMCRIWVDGVPANRQPAPTDCASAVKNRPANGRVVFGEREGSSASPPPFLRSFGDRDRAKGRDRDKDRDKDKQKERRIPVRRP